MPEQAKKIMETINKIVPNLTEMEKERLLAFGEGVAFMANQQQARDSGGSGKEAHT